MGCWTMTSCIGSKLKVLLVSKLLQAIREGAEPVSHILLQKNEVVFHIVSVTLQFLPHLLHFLHQLPVQVLPVQHHGLTELVPAQSAPPECSC